MLKLIKRLKKIALNQASCNIEKNILDYLTYAYPSNHTYRLSNGKIKPHHKLLKRYQQIQILFPEKLHRMADIGCSKGFFIFSIHDRHPDSYCLGIDVHQPDIDACEQVKKYLHKSDVFFKRMQLHELAEQIDEFGGPFELLLLLNTYQYLYFGSEGHRERYLDHDLIFKYLRTICRGRIIFNNRLDFTDCQQQVKQLAWSHSKLYSREAIFSTAKKYFFLTEHGNIGKYPLLTMDVIAET